MYHTIIESIMIMRFEIDRYIMHPCVGDRVDNRLGSAHFTTVAR